MSETDIEFDTGGGAPDAPEFREPEEPEEVDEAPEKKDEYAPPTREEWNKTREQLEKANAQAKRYRLEARNLREQAASDPEAVTKAKAEADSHWKPRIVKATARAALAEAGLTGDADDDRMSDLLRMIDMDELEVDDDGEVEGLDDQISRLKTRFPELFKKRGSGRIDATDRGAPGAPKKPQSSADRLAAMLQ